MCKGIFEACTGQLNLVHTAAQSSALRMDQKLHSIVKGFTHKTCASGRTC